MEQLDCVVIGAGVVGLAVARALALAGRDVVIVEAENCIGSGTSSRNSEVIHAGIYYPAGSLKARLCVQGKEALYAYCAERGIAHRRCGKLIVATDSSQLAQLEQIRGKAAANGVHDLRVLSQDEAQAMEPGLRCTGALLSPSTGIIDSHGLMLGLLGDAEQAGATLVLQAPLEGGRVGQDGLFIHVQGETWQARSVINCAGIHAPAVAATLQGLDARFQPRAYYAKGNYFSCSVRAPFSHLIYPVPEQAGLGVHLTLDLAGRARFGPDVEWVESPDYAVDVARADSFYAEIRRYWPALPDHALRADYAGIRPKLDGPGHAAADFRIDDASVHGIPGLVNLFGIESPGLTSSLALAELVSAKLKD
ncbi:NAD(P)/FAD-dependent oxidoreductase [Pseudoduganella ginsengisoli]|uniref:FAD-dependent oxidoreductase n=1 Tax=Pseudoduganella ginsengisoli TaxID=1462440 RepID=A0A6L6PZP6_9BURK|nr:FAD-dependent oxidoreductase [Pseudoduganella ginsengisoli]